MKRLLTVVSFVIICRLCSATVVTGIIQNLPPEEDESDLQLFYLSKFGVAAGSSMYVFGNVFLDSGRLIPLDSKMLLALIPQTVLDKLLYMISEAGDGAICRTVIPNVFNDSISVDDKRCYSGSKDYLRIVPCRCSNGTYTSCNQPEEIRVVNGTTFTYHINSAPSTEFYYLFFLGCNRNTSDTCTWGSTGRAYFHYDISLVNSDLESGSSPDPFTYQFSYHVEGVLIILIIFSVGYTILVAAHVVLHSRLCTRDYRMPCLLGIFTVSILFDYLHCVLELIHMAVFASNGVGAVWCNYLGEISNQFSDWLLFLVLLLIGRGWMITTSTLRSKKGMLTLWIAYVFFFAIYFVWTVVQDQVYPVSITTQHSYQSWPGAFYLAYRLFLLLCILYEMRHVYLVENRPEKLKLYIVLAVFYILWFCYLPFVVFLVAFINPVYKYKVILSFVLTFDFLANFGMVLLFVPRWSKVLFQFDSHLNSSQVSTYRTLNSFNYGSSKLTPSAVI